MNISNIAKSDTHLHFSCEDGGLIAYNVSISTMVIHAYNKEGECYQGNYFPMLNSKEKLKARFMERLVTQFKLI